MLKIKELLTKQLNLELLAAVQMAYCAGVTDSSSLREHFCKFARVELEHFTAVANILNKMYHETNIEPLDLNLEKDELRMLIVLAAIEDTMINYYQDILSPDTSISPAFKTVLRDNLRQEKGHKQEMTLLLQETKENIKKKTA